MSTRVHLTVENPTDYTLTLFKQWGGPWGTPPPDTVSARANVKFSLNDNDRAGCVYLATDSAGNEMGFVTMSFTCPKSSGNSAEGSPATGGTFLSAGLQTYKTSGTPANFTYKIGQANNACWSSGSSNNGKIECDETSMETWTRNLISVSAPTDYSLNLAGTWADSSVSNWGKNPATVPAGGKRIFLLDDNDRAGIYYQCLDASGNEAGYATLSFTCPKSSSNSAEGSSEITNIFVDAGLQKYQPHGTPANFMYEVGSPNQACWSSGSSNDGTTECDQTELNGRAKTVVSNTTDYLLTYTSKWDESGGPDAWYFDPAGDIAPGAHKLLVLSTNDRAGVFYATDEAQYHLSFTCPKLSSNSAEGSPFSGLQKYTETGCPVTFTYNVGSDNLACWSSGSSNDGTIVCPQTKVQNPTPKAQYQEALLCATLSAIAYQDQASAKAALSALDPSYSLENWFDDSATDTQGFLAYSESSKTVALVFRGTESITDVNIDLYQEQVPFDPGVDPRIKVVKGFDLAYSAVQSDVMSAVTNLLNTVDVTTISRFYVTGHSLGGALATLSGLQMAFLLDSNYKFRNPSVLKAITLAAPPAGNTNFHAAFQRIMKVSMTAFAYGLTNDPVATGKWTVAPGIVIDFEQWDYQQAATVNLIETDLTFPASHLLANYIAELESLV